MKTKPVYLWLFWMMLICSCSGTQSVLHNEITGADISARVFNASLPVWVQEYRREGIEAIDRACPSRPCDPAIANAAYLDNERRWMPVSLAWEGLKSAHDRWRSHLNSCLDQLMDAGADVQSLPCTMSASDYERDFLVSGNQFRCAVRALKPDLDPLREFAPPVCDLDGGTR